MKRDYTVLYSTESHKFWSPQYKGISFKSEKELHAWVSHRNAKKAWNSFIDLTFSMFSFIFKMGLLCCIFYGIVKFIKFCWLN